MDWFPEFILKYLNFDGKCFRHCDRSTSMQTLLHEPSRVVGAYVCPDGFVSQVVYFSTTPDIKWFEKMVSEQVGAENLASKDIRVGSRHGWELDGDARRVLESTLGVDGKITEVYWTRYAKTDAEKRVQISLCPAGGLEKRRPHLFAHDSNKTDRFCPSCQTK